MGISFLNPFLLYGIAAISIPIIIHMMNRQKVQKVVWAAMRFIQESLAKNEKRMKVEDLILLLLRCLILILVALALARPSAPSQQGLIPDVNSGTTAVLILDNSYSMGKTDGVEVRFKIAQSAAEKLLSGLPKGSSVALLLSSDRYQSLIPNPTQDLELVKGSIRRAVLSDYATDYFPALKQGFEILKKGISSRKEIYFISDGQALGCKNMDKMVAFLEKMRKEGMVYFIDVGDSELSNAAVSGLELSQGLAPIKRPVRFEIKVTNFGALELRNVKVTLQVDVNPATDEGVIDVIPPKGSKTITLYARFEEEGIHSVTARIPEDRLAVDDARSLSVRAFKELNVLLVDGDPGREPRESQTFYLRHALTPVPLLEKAGYFIKPTVQSVGEISSVRFEDYDAVVLAGVSEIASEEVLKGLQQYVLRGGGLAIFPGKNTQRDFYNKELLAKYQLLPAALGDLKGNAEKALESLQFQAKDYDHPITVLWNNPDAGTLTSAHFLNVYELKMEDEKNGKKDGEVGKKMVGPASRIILRYSNGSTAIAERLVGQGRVILFGFAGNTWRNDFPTRPSFVPFLHRALGTLVQQKDRDLNVFVGESLGCRVTPDMLGKEVQVSKPRAKDFEKKVQQVEMVDGDVIIQFKDTDQSGAYVFTCQGGNPSLIRMAVQFDPAESNLDVMTPDQVEALRRFGAVAKWDPSLSFDKAIQNVRLGKEYASWLLFLALMVAATETVLSQVFSRSK